MDGGRMTNLSFLCTGYVGDFKNSDIQAIL